MQQYAAEIEGDMDDLIIQGLSPEKINDAAAKAINKAADRARTASAKKIREQVRFPASYLNPSRLGVKRRASVSSLTALIEGRDTATSLARFLRGTPVVRTREQQQSRRLKGEVVQVAKGGRGVRIKRAFVIKLRSGNMGLAVRTAGGSPAGAYKPKEIGKNLWLLYGPSVNQVLYSVKNEGGVFQEIETDTADFLTNEFYRLLGVDFSGN